MSVPHQCPVCEGSGMKYGAVYTQCRACGGRGIVWSPVELKPCELPWREMNGTTACPGWTYWCGDATETPDGVTA